MFTTKWLASKRDTWYVGYTASVISLPRFMNLPSETSATSLPELFAQPVNTCENLIELTFGFTMMQRK